jgi:hypothetical protein
MYKLKAGKKLRGLKMADEIIKKQNTSNELAVKAISSHIDPLFGNRQICTRIRLYVNNVQNRVKHCISGLDNFNKNKECKDN